MPHHTAEQQADHARDLPPIEYLHECFECDAERGILTWRERPRTHFLHARQHSQTNTLFAGRQAGSRHCGYIYVQLCGLKIRAHRIVWAMHTGAWPAGFLDHKNGDKADNRIANLREATRAQNAANVGAAARNKVGLKGVSPHHKRFRAQIRTAGKVLYLGIFDTPELAHAAYAVAAALHHGEFAGGIDGAL